jgi:hypothetical protein
MTTATTTEGDASSAATVDSTSAPAPALDAAATQSPTTALEPTQDAANTAEGDGKEGDKNALDTKPDVPEKYDFKLPENVPMDEASLNAFSEFAKDAGLNQETAQAMLSKLAPAMQERQAQAQAEIKAQWTESTKADKEIGGVQLDQNLKVAMKALKAFGTPELQTLLNESGLGDHPELIRAFYRAGKTISEDSFVPAGTAARQANRDFSSQLYPNQSQH